MSFEDRWAGNERECVDCGRLIHNGSRMQMRCRNCEEGIAAPVAEVVIEETPPALYPLLRMTPEELAASRERCRTFDEEQLEESRRTYDPRSGAADYCPVYPRITEEESNAASVTRRELRALRIARKARLEESRRKAR